MTGNRLAQQLFGPGQGRFHGRRQARRPAGAGAATPLAVAAALGPARGLGRAQLHADQGVESPFLVGQQLGPVGLGQGQRCAASFGRPGQGGGVGRGTGARPGGGGDTQAAQEHDGGPGHHHGQGDERQDRSPFGV